MTLEEAIKLLKYYEDPLHNESVAKRREARKLGIEALKRIKMRRDLGTGYEPKLLPGETEK